MLPFWTFILWALGIIILIVGAYALAKPLSKVGGMKQGWKIALVIAGSIIVLLGFLGFLNP